MTATVAPLRPVRSPAPLSAEREALRLAIERLASAESRLSRIEAAQVKARELSSRSFFESEELERALAEARAAEPRRLVDSLLGEKMAPGRSVADIERSLTETRAARAAYEEARDTLATERQAAEQSLGIARGNRNSAVSAILRVSPGLAQLLNDFADARRQYASLRLALRWLAGLPRDALTDFQRADLDTHVDGWPADPAPILAQWQPAVAALEHDAGAPLPGDN